jgi:hypothetical protein
MGIFSIRISPAMGGATILSDGYSVGRRIFGLDRERPTAFEAAILALGILLIAAAIAACFTIFISCMHAAYFPHDTKLKTELRSTLPPDFEGEHAAVATKAPAVALDSPFASRGGLLFLSTPVGSEPLPEGQASGFSSAERLPAGLVVGALFPAKAPSDEHDMTAPLQRLRSFTHNDMQPRKGTADSADVAAAPKAPVAATPLAPSASFAFLEKLFHFWQARNDIKLTPEADAHTAVYDIERHVVYLPNGEKLEAHSGMGKLLDDVRYVKEKDRGPTPPNVYRLTLRESLFHGVQAVRLNPVDGAKMYGREGMLAHPYMLGPDGQSNGCISVQDYPKFLEAFLRGEIDRLIVVPRLEGTPSYAASSVARDDKRYALQ